MKVLLDECLPAQVRKLLLNHSVATVGEAGWAGFENGELAERARDTFDVILTADKRFASATGEPTRRIAIVILRAESNKIESLQPLIPQVLDVLERIGLGQIVVVEEKR